MTEIIHTKHVMIDIETWGTGLEALVVSIGAVKFDPFKSPGQRDAWETFHVGINPVPFFERFKPTAETIMWWMDPKQDEPRKRWLNMQKIDIGSALDGFLDWYGPESLPTWGNGATFDLVIMRNVFDKMHQECPWKFYHERCYRTIKSLPGMPPRPPFPDHTEAHDALSDAFVQAMHLQIMLDQLHVVDDAGGFEKLIEGV